MMSEQNWRAFELMPQMPVSEKTVLLRECNSDLFSIGYSNQEKDSYFNFLQTGICLLLFESLRRKLCTLGEKTFARNVRA